MDCYPVGTGQGHSGRGFRRCDCHALRMRVGIVRQFRVIPEAVKRQPQGSRVPVKKHRKKHEPGNQWWYDVAVGIFQRDVKENVRHRQRGRRPAVIDIRRAEEVAGFSFKLEVALAAPFVHPDESAEQFSDAAQRAS